MSTKTKTIEKVSNTKSKEVKLTNREVVNSLQHGLQALGNYSMTDFETNLLVCQNMVTFKEIGDAINKTLGALQTKHCKINPETKQAETKFNAAINAPELVFLDLQNKKAYSEAYEKLMDQPVTAKVHLLKTSVLKEAKDSSGNAINSSILFLCSSILNDDLKIIK